MPTFTPNQLERLVTSLLEKAGAPPQHASLVAHHLVEANLMGHDSHGVLRVTQYVTAMEKGEVVASATPSIVRENRSSLVLDGRFGFGQVAASEAMRHAVDKARENGVAAVTLRNCYHTGRVGAYAQIAAHAGLIGIVLVNAGGGGQSVAPFGGIQRRLATNPLAIAAPSSGEFPLLLDMATSMAPEGKLRDHALRGAPLPEGWIVDAEGRPSQDPRDFYGPPPGALLPLGGTAGHKGFGLALMIDILAGALSGAGCCQAGAPRARDGLLLMALDIESFAGEALYGEQVTQLVTYVKSCPAAPAYEHVLVPGECEYRQEQRRRQSGIWLDETIWLEIVQQLTRYGVKKETTRG